VNKPRGPLAERFWRKVEKSDGCWLWKGGRLPIGYGKIREGGVHGKHLLAHRVAWVLSHGAIPDGMCVLHRCDVRACVNPAHLFLGTLADNSADMVAKGRQCRGIKNPRNVLSEDDVLSIIDWRADGISANHIAASFGISRATVYRVLAMKDAQELATG